MEYRNYNNVIYLRLDKGDEVLSSILGVCKKEGVRSCVFSGIGGCDYAKIGTFVIEKGTYNNFEKEGMLELVSLNGDIKETDQGPQIHAHACLSFEEDGQNKLIGGHLLRNRNPSRPGWRHQGEARTNSGDTGVGFRIIPTYICFILTNVLSCFWHHRSLRPQ